MIIWHNKSTRKGNYQNHNTNKMLQFKDSKTKSLFRETFKSLNEEKQSKFAREVKKLADKKLVSDSQDFEVNVNDLRAVINSI